MVAKFPQRSITFSGSFSPNGGSYLAVYTWVGDAGPNAVAETYILENAGSYEPGDDSTYVGTFDSDGGTYDVYKIYLHPPNAQYWSIRQQKRTSGTVTTSNHYNWYNSHGMPFDPSVDASYQIVSVEGFGSSGSADITVGEA